MANGDSRWRWLLAMANGIELETLNLKLWLLAMADGDAPLNASTSQRINLCL
ncbi:MAG: hypothetical protein IKK62_12390 [Bacteroidaceae bacterium]|nr:hypothetical protein [Bacteroidaceae bacterium]